MASKLVQPPIPALPRTTNRARAHRLIPQPQWRSRNASFSDFPSGFSSIYTPRVAENTRGIIGDDTLVRIKSELYQAVEGLNRGIFGVTSAKRSEIEGLVSLLESQNPTPDPTLNLEKVSGCWRLIYSTITILGSKRTKLGLRDFISLGDFLQIIDINKGKAVNVIKFSVRGLNMLNGQLAIEASFKIASKLRVDISYDNSTIIPDQLMSLFHKNYHLLLSIFNPEGWLEITKTRFENCCLTRSNYNRYVDDTMRIGRDGKGNIFVLDRSEEDNS